MFQYSASSSGYTVLNLAENELGSEYACVLMCASELVSVYMLRMYVAYVYACTYVCA